MRRQPRSRASFRTTRASVAVLTTRSVTRIAASAHPCVVRSGAASPFRGHSGGIGEFGAGEYEIACLACREKVDTFLKTIGGITHSKGAIVDSGSGECHRARRWHPPDTAGVIHRRITAFQSPEKSIRDAGRTEGPQCRQGGREGHLEDDASRPEGRKRRRRAAPRNREELMEEQRTRFILRMADDISRSSERVCASAAKARPGGCELGCRNAVRPIIKQA